MPTLNWIGKEAVVNHNKEVPFKLLKKVKAHSVGENSQNLIIKGDNLEGLKALMPYYIGKVKCIYIDPPYNTGNESWIYNDKVNSPKIKKWLGKVVGGEAEDLCRHDKWLCMMYPRLKLLRELLSEDGVIFVSIDDNEQAHLKLLMDEIFGEENRVSDLIWFYEGVNDNQAMIRKTHEYILVYAKNYLNLSLNHIQDPNVELNDLIINSIVKNGIKNPESEIKLPKGFPVEFKEGILKKENISSIKYSKDIKVKDFKLTEEVIAKSGWSSKRILELFIQNEFNPVIDSNGQSTQFIIQKSGNIFYKKQRDQGYLLSVLRNLGTTMQSGKEIRSMGLNFSFPKPRGLISFLIKMFSSKEDLILDSFAGSGTTGHAVLDLNKEDGGNRKFILIEMEDDIARKITAERIKRAIEKYDYKDGFEYCELDKPLFNEDGQIEEECGFEQLATYIYFTENKMNINKAKIERPFIGTSQDENREYYLIFKEKGKNKLSRESLKHIKKNLKRKIVYADQCLLSQDELDKNNIQFKQIPYEVERY